MGKKAVKIHETPWKRGKIKVTRAYRGGIHTCRIIRVYIICVTHFAPYSSETLIKNALHASGDFILSFVSPFVYVSQIVHRRGRKRRRGEWMLRGLDIARSRYIEGVPSISRVSGTNRYHPANREHPRGRYLLPTTAIFAWNCRARSSCVPSSTLTNTVVTLTHKWTWRDKVEDLWSSSS